MWLKVDKLTVFADTGQKRAWDKKLLQEKQASRTAACRHGKAAKRPSAAKAGRDISDEHYAAVIKNSVI